MSFRHCLVVYALLISLNYIHNVQGGQTRMFPLTRFSCIGKANGYYADVDTGCQVYHMCDGMGRQFSYKCPNMTLFQQRMLICDHWYMVNCSMSERDYDANLLIGQRDKPFVSDDEMRLRTPRPDILSVPPYNPYFDALKTDTKVDEVEDNDLDTKQSRNHVRPNDINRRQDTLSGSDENEDVGGQFNSPRNLNKYRPNRPSVDLLPPFSPKSESSSEEEYDSTTTQDEAPVFKFLKRFDPTSDEDQYTKTISKSEIIELNSHLPDQQVSEEDKNDRRSKNIDNTVQNNFKSNKDIAESSKTVPANTKSKTAEPFKPQKKTGAAEPDRILLPPKLKSEAIPTSTVGPPIYYEWRWSVPAFDLVPPKEDNQTVNTTNNQQPRAIDSGRNPFSTVTRPEPVTTTPEPSHVEYNISSYFVPDYVFPLDKEHPGYESEDAQTSFQVHVPRPGRASYGEDSRCPECHPAYLAPGSCEPCIIERTPALTDEASEDAPSVLV